MESLNKVIFLDYDGVVNTPMWHEDGSINYNYPSDGKVNNFQAIMWLNNLLWRTGAKIVVSSTWRYCCHDTSYQDCLYNAGLKDKYEIIGCTPWFGNETRTEEIHKYLEEHPEIDRYVILDDENVDDDNFVKCEQYYGFGYKECVKAIEILNREEL